MFEKMLETVIAIDTDAQAVHFYTVKGSGAGAISHEVEGFRAGSFDDECYERLGNILGRFREKNPSRQMQRVSLVLPDHVFLTDTVNIPVVNRRTMENSLLLALASLYRNLSELKFHHFLGTQNKQYATYGVVAVRKEMLTKLRNVCSLHQMGVQNITFAANAAADAALVLNPKLKNTSFVLLDIKEDTARIVLVAKGRTVGSFPLPFGYSILYKTRLAAEDLLFDHASGELLVLNAKERAKAKALTAASEDWSQQQEGIGEEEGETEGENEGESVFSEQNSEPLHPPVTETLSKKTPRKLPKFMLRDLPDTREGFIYENFRLFMKWTLDVIAGNTDITSLGMPEAVYVNLPSEYQFLYDMVNAEAEENKIRFLPLTGAELPQEIRENLELYGGACVRQYNKLNNF